MYSPKHYQTSDADLIKKIVVENQFATLIAGEQISHLPLLLDGDRLIGHMARMNPQWKTFPRDVLAIFQGPHGYISPAWYDEAEDNVPTWNYVATHVKGHARLLENPYDALEKLVVDNERRYGTGWQLKRNIEVDKLTKAIVSFEITDLTFEGKLKLSQKSETTERDRVIENLGKLGHTELAEWMKLTRKP